MGPVSVDDDYTYKGFRLVIIENDHLRIVVLPEKGADIYQFIDKRHNVDLLWKTPMGLRERVRDLPPGYGAESNFTDAYEGGWQMVFPNGGSSCSYKGLRLEMCGDAQACSWRYRILEKGPDIAVVAFETEMHRLPYRLRRIIRIDRGAASMQLTEIISNDGQEPLDYMWGQHIAFEGSLLRSGDWQLVVPCSRVGTNTGPMTAKSALPAGARVNRLPTDGEFGWPMVKGADGSDIDLSLFPDDSVKSCDIAYLHELEDGWYALLNKRLRYAFHLSWQRELFPCIWFYQNFNGSFGYPWYGRGNGVALEPISGFPALGLEESMLRGNHMTIQAGEEIRADFHASIVSGHDIDNYTSA